MLFRGQRIHVSTERLRQAFALVSLGVPMDRIQKGLGLKAETIKTWLKRVLNLERWEVLAADLENNFGIPARAIEQFKQEMVVLRSFDSSVYRAWASSFQRLGPGQRAGIRRIVARIAGRRAVRIIMTGS